MTPTKEMIVEWFKENHRNASEHDYMMYWAGIAAYAHLSSPGSDEWKREHGFSEKGGQDE